MSLQERTEVGPVGGVAVISEPVKEKLGAFVNDAAGDGRKEIARGSLRVISEEFVECGGLEDVRIAESG